MFVSDGLINESDAKKNGFYRLIQREENKQIREYLLNKYGKFSGFVYNNKYEGKGKSFIVLNPTQIKLADGTNTTFNGNNPDIRFKNGGSTDNSDYFIPANGTLMTKDKKTKLDYKKVGNDYEFSVFDGEQNPVENYSRVQYKKRSNNKVLMNYNQFVDYLYNEGYIDDKFKNGGETMTNTDKLIQEITKNSNVEYGVVSTTTDGEKYRYVRYRYKNPISPNWLVMLYEKAAEENGKKYGTQFFYKDYSFYYDRHPLKNMPNGSMGFKVLEILPSDFANGGLVDEIAQIKSEINKLYSKAFKMFPNSPKQKEVIKQIDELRLKLETMGEKMAHGGSVDGISLGQVNKINQDLNASTKSRTSNGLEISILNKWSDKQYLVLNYMGFANYPIQEFFIGSGPNIKVDWTSIISKIEGSLNDFKNLIKYTKWDAGSIKYTSSYKYEIQAKINALTSLKEIILNTIQMKEGGSVDAKDTVTVDIPLMIRLLELSREDIHSDAELHMVVERLLDLKNKPVLTMDDYSYIAEIEHKHLSKMALGGNLETERLISEAHTNLTVKKGRRDYAPTSTEIQEEIDRMIMEGQFGSTNI